MLTTVLLHEDISAPVLCLALYQAQDGLFIIRIFHFFGHLFHNIDVALIRKPRW